MFQSSTTTTMIPTPRANNQRAVVIGGSLAGLLAAKVLSPHFREVVILERDPVRTEPEARKSQRHALHTHILLKRGLDVLCNLYPNLLRSLEAKGAQVVDFAEQAQWYVAGGKKRQHEDSFHHLLVSRPLLEAEIREQTSQIQNVQLISHCCCKSLLFDNSKSRVVGVAVEARKDRESDFDLHADLVIDASGRGSKAPKWLEQSGFTAPEDERIHIDVGYATRLYRQPAGRFTGGGLILVQPVGPHESTGGCLVPLENNLWSCTLSGWGGQHPSLEPTEFDRFAASLPSPALWEATRELEPVGEVVTYKYLASRWRRYDRMREHPAGFVVIGDAVCSFNPIFGQGMTSTACQVDILRQLLESGVSSSGIWKPLYKRGSRIIRRAWQTAAAGDFQFPKTKGKKPFGIGLINRYVTCVQRACHRDPIVYRAYLNVTNMMTSPRSLLRPDIVFRILTNEIYRAATYCRHSTIRKLLTRSTCESDHERTTYRFNDRPAL